MNLKQQLKLYLKEQGISASELSRKTGISKQSISDWLAGVHPRDLGKVKKVADQLGVTVDHLIFGQGIEIQTAHTRLETTEDGWVTGIFEVRYRKVKG